MAEVVGAEGQLEAVLRGAALGDGHHTGVVDQQIQRAAALGQLPGEGRDGGQVGEVEHLGAHRGAGNGTGEPVGGGADLVGGASRQHDLGARARQLDGGDLADAAVGAGHDGEAALLAGKVL